jgi:hypothetical protein
LQNLQQLSSFERGNLAAFISRRFDTLLQINSRLAASPSFFPNTPLEKPTIPASSSEASNGTCERSLAEKMLS